jgi:hypothetical protein
MDEIAGGVADSVEILTQRTGRRQTHLQIFQPPMQGHRFFLQQSRVLVFATTRSSPQH